MIEAVDGVSLVLWAVAFLAAGMYPLGFMLGAPCSPCCEPECGEPFYRCLRQKSVAGSAPSIPSQHIFYLSDAGIIKASSYATAELSRSIGLHTYLQPEQTCEYVFEVRASHIILDPPAPAVHSCDDTFQEYRVRVVGQQAGASVQPPLRDGNLITVGSNYAGTLSLPVRFVLGGHCMRDAKYAWTAAPVRVEGTPPPGGVVFVEYTPVVVLLDMPQDTYVFYLAENSGLGGGENTNAEQVQAYREGTGTMRTVDGAGYAYDIEIVDATPLCAVKLCSGEVPLELLPQGVTYTPESGKKWGCDDAVNVVLGNLGSYGLAIQNPCLYWHSVKRCGGDAAIQVGLWEFFTEWYAHHDPYVAYGRLDLLTWLDFDPQPLVKPGDGVYTVAGVYDPGFRRDGLCLPPTLSPPGLQIPSFFSPRRDGTCQPAEYTVSVSSASFVYDQIGADPSFFAGDYVLSPHTMGGCGGEFYASNLLVLRWEGTVAASTISVEYTRTPALGAECLGNTVDGAKINGGYIHPTLGVSVGVSAVCGSAVSTPCQAATINYNSFQLPPGSRAARGTVSISATPSQTLLQQCGDATISPAAITVEGQGALGIASVSVGTDAGSDVVVSGLHQVCGYEVLESSLWNPTDIDREFKWYVRSDGSPSRVLAITVPGRCRSVLARALVPKEQETVFYSQPVARSGGCLLLAVKPNFVKSPGNSGKPFGSGESCSWSAASDAEWALVDEDTVSGVGTGYVKVHVSEMTVSAPRFRNAKITVTLDADQTAKSVVQLSQDYNLE